MDVIGILFGLALLGACLLVVIIGLSIGGLFLYGCWPVAVGIGVGGYVWYSGHDNLGVLIFVVSMIGQFFWSAKLPKGRGGSSNPMSSKSKIYDKSGNVRGYIDKN